MTTFFSILLVLLGVVMIFVILLQRGRGGGLIGAFGAGGGGSAFGTKTGDVFTTITVVLFVLFMFLAIGLNWMVQGKTPVAASRPAATTQGAMTTTKSTTASTTPTAAPAAATTGTRTSKPAVATKVPAGKAANAKPAATHP